MIKFVVLASLLALSHAAPKAKPSHEIGYGGYEGGGYSGGYEGGYGGYEGGYGGGAHVIGHYNTYAKVKTAYVPVVKHVPVNIVSTHTDLHFDGPSYATYGGYGHGGYEGYGGYSHGGYGGGYSSW